MRNDEYLARIVNSAKTQDTRALIWAVTESMKATLALVEQQRIANLIALAGSTHRLLNEQVATDAAEALADFKPHEDSPGSGWHELRPDIAAALRVVLTPALDHAAQSTVTAEQLSVMAQFIEDRCWCQSCGSGEEHARKLLAKAGLTVAGESQ